VSERLRFELRADQIGAYNWRLLDEEDKLAIGCGYKAREEAVEAIRMLREIMNESPLGPIPVYEIHLNYKERLVL